MTLDLSRTLHSAVDLVEDVSPGFDVSRVAARVRRRRQVRVGVRAGVGVAAAGAVALAANQLTRPSELAGLPAARADAAAGECGSRISLLDRPTPAEAGLVTGGTTEFAAGELELPPAGGSLGTYVGEYLSATAVRTLPRSGQSRALDAVGSAADLAGEQAGRLAADMQILLVRGDTVVATDRVAVSPGATGFWTDQTTGLLGTQIDQSLRACSEPGRPGGDRLPAGTYDAYVGYAKNNDGVATKAAGPWTVTVEQPVRATDLPAGLPPVPLLPGRVDYVKRNGDTWLVNVVADATDRFEAAGQALVPVAVVRETPTWQTTAHESVVVSDGVPVPVTLADGSRWSVTVRAFETESGEPSLVYEITPDS